MQILKFIMDSPYSCGNLGLSFAGSLPYVVSMVITIIKIVVPILLIIFGMIDMAKAVMAQKEDEIKKGQQTLIKRVIAAVVVFFVITIVQMLVKFLANGNTGIINCFNCFVTGEESDTEADAKGCYLDGSGTTDGD